MPFGPQLLRWCVVFSEGACPQREWIYRGGTFDDFDPARRNFQQNPGEGIIRVRFPEKTSRKRKRCNATAALLSNHWRVSRNQPVDGKTFWQQVRSTTRLH